jgi:hypothetical protein
VRVPQLRTEMIIRATRTQNVLGTSRVLVCLLFNFLLLLLFFIFYFLNIEKRCKGKIRSL